MIREIKFRAWDEPNKEILSAETGVFFYEADNGFHCGYNATEKTPKVGAGDWVNCPVMQFTGLTDSHGAEIYEGDILSEPVSPVGGKNGGYLYKNRAIKWLGAGRGYDLHCPSAASSIVGNIHENPELLEA